MALEGIRGILWKHRFELGVWSLALGVWRLEFSFTLALGVWA